MKTLILFLLAALSAFAQDPRQQYVTVKETSSATEKVTIQQPTSGARLVIFDYAKVQCTVATTATLSVEGTAATTTALVPTPMNASVAAAAVAFRSSNVGAGTTIDTYLVAAGAMVRIDLSTLSMPADGTAHNLTIATDTSSGTCRITIKHYETRF